MVSSSTLAILYGALFLGCAHATPQDMDLPMSMARQIETFPIVKAELLKTLPGIVCELDGQADLEQDEVTYTVEAQLAYLFPTVKCSGKIDDKVFEAFKQASTDAVPEEYTSPADNSSQFTKRIWNERQIGQHEQAQRRTAEVQRDTQGAYCNAAPSPERCRICVAAEGTNAAGKVGVCAATAYGAAAVTGGVLLVPAWLGFIACSVAAIASSAAAMTACWGR